jgi:hypothetical protein
MVITNKPLELACEIWYSDTSLWNMFTSDQLLIGNSAELKGYVWQI